MRKSSLVLMGLLVLLFAGLLLASGWMHGTYEEDLARSADLTRLLAGQGLLREGTRVLVLRRSGGGERRLAPDGQGLLIEFAPAPDLLERAGGLPGLIERTCREAQALLPPGTPVDWFELAVQLETDARAPRWRTLVRRDAYGTLAPPDPAPPPPPRPPAAPDPAGLPGGR